MIRHGMTRGNAEKRYIGTTDESLLPEEAERLERLFREACQKETSLLTRSARLEMIVSPMRRCRETADVLMRVIGEMSCCVEASEDRQGTIRVVRDLRECDFGAFEYRNYEELKDEPAYQRFLDTHGESGFPGGEDRQTFSKRCTEAFAAVCRELSDRECAAVFVVHGGTIMAVMDAFAQPRRDYYDWQVRPGEGFSAELEWECDEAGTMRPVLTDAAPLLPPAD